MKQKILICDDEEGVVESLKLITGELYEAVVAHNGKDALSAIEADSEIRLVLLDIKMPQKSGLEVLKELKARNPGIPVIIITGYQSVEAAAEAIKYGAANYIVKPLDTKSVLDAIAKAL